VDGFGRRRPALHGFFAFVDERLDIAGLHPPTSADLKAAQPAADQKAAGGGVVDAKHRCGLAQ
jgi:hypothetical protein